MFKRYILLILAIAIMFPAVAFNNGQVHASGEELLVNPGFENGLSGWYTQGTQAAAEEGEFVYSGDKSARVYNRQETWGTVVQNIAAKLRTEGSGEYRFSAHIRLAEEAIGTTSRLVVKLVDDAGTRFIRSEATSINHHSFVKIQTTDMLTWTGTLQNAEIYFITTTGTTSYYVDEFSLIRIGDVKSPQLLSNPGFEQGTNFWSAQSAQLHIVEQGVHEGSQALRISSRTADWSTARQDVTQALESYGPGTYELRGYAKLDSETYAVCRPLLVVRYNDGGSDKYATIARTDVTNEAYTELSGIVDLNWSGVLSSAFMYIQTGTSGSECLNSLYIDDLSLKRVGRDTPIPPDPGNSELNLALNKPVEASSTLSGYSSSNITDGNNDTSGPDHWAADVSEEPQWVTIDLQNNVKFNRIEFYTPLGYEQRNYEIQYWTTGGWINIFPAVMANTSDHNSYVFEPLISSKLRIYMGESDGEDIARIAEIEVYHDPNLALGKPVAASSVQNASYSATYINDGNKVLSGWRHWAGDVSEDPQWVEIDLEEMMTFRRVEFYSPSSYEQREYTIQYWDGSQWLGAFPAVTGNSEDHNSHSFEPVTGSKLRVYMTEGNMQQHGQDGGENVARIVEVEVYNTSGVFVDNIVVPEPIPQSIGERQTKTAVGAIRWDMWGSTDNPLDIGSQTERVLSPEKYHFRLPWYAEITGPNEVHIPQYTQEIVDQEIHFAKEAGIDYWAFVMYESPTARDLYLSSAYKNDVKWSAILGASSYSFDNFPWLVSQFKTSNYQTVLDGRPLVYVWHTNKRYVDELRAEAQRQETAEPYIVIMGTNGKIMRQMQGDALSQYTNFGAGGSPYSSVAGNDRNNWDLLADYGAQVIPTVTAGWDPRPRIDDPVSWTSYGENNWAQQGSAEEIAANLKNALDWNAANPESSLPNAVLIYAWNENDEGGWIMPTLFEMRDEGRPVRLDAIANVIRESQAEPTVTLTGSEQAVAGQSFELTIGTAHLEGDYELMNVVVDYDPEKLEFEMVGAEGEEELAASAFEPLLPGIGLVGSAIVPDAGRINLVIGAAGGVLPTDEDLFKLVGQVKAGVGSGETTLSLSHAAVISAEEGELSLDVSNVSHQLMLGIQEQPGDRAELLAVIAAAEVLQAATQEGSKLGQYTAGAKAALGAAITAARNAGASQSAIDVALAALETALGQFRSQIVTLVPGATKVTLRDLAIVAKYYGIAEGEEGWSDIEKADVVGVNVIDIRNLAAIAKIILNEWRQDIQ